MKKFKISKWLLALAVGVMVATGLQSPTASKAAYPGKWDQDENGWKYVEHDNQGNEWTVENGFRFISGKWYGFADGYMVTGGWKKVYSSDVYAGADGALLTGWQDIDGKTYYFYSTGRLATDTTIDGKYYVDKKGVYIGANQWKHDDRGWYYEFANPNQFSKYDSATRKYIYSNRPKNRYVTIDGAAYVFNEDGYMCTGWCSTTNETNAGLERTWYYADTNGKLVRGWKQIDGTWYYFNDYGRMMCNDVVEGYHLGEDGALIGKDSGWIKDDRGWWYQTSVPLTAMGTDKEISDYPRDGIYKIDGEFYCFDADGYMITGWVDARKYIDYTKLIIHDGEKPVWFYFNEDGTLGYTNRWQQIDGVWYYFVPCTYGFHIATDMVVAGYEFDENGGYKKVETTWSWKTDGTKWWYEDTDGEYKTNGTYYIDGKNYAFDGNGYMLTGWVDTSKLGYASSSSQWYYFEADGTGADGWKQIDGAWYYFSDGYMYSNMVVDDCYINSDGVWVDPDPGYAL